ncbi:hypothetical protein [Georgenia deserti]|uniref:DUF1707 domain-containing protein n=1 Tax=Georgenia deserti TaxID=2093781 RepID=A0ABW4L1Z2_9MICO
MTITPPATRRRSWHERIRRELYLAHVSLWLEDDAPSTDRTAVLTQLRGDLDAAAEGRSMRAAIGEVGKARHLAAAYSDSLRPGPNRPLWATGGAAACVWLTVCLLAAVVFVIALVQAAPLAGEDGVRAHLLWSEFTVVNTPDRVWVELDGQHWTLLVTVGVFLGFARVWRLGRRRGTAG